MNIIYKSRGEGKTTELVKMSASTGIPIVCIDTRHINYIAKELDLNIPVPIAIKNFKPFINDKILVDDAEYILQHLIGKIECMTISKSK